MTQSVLFSAPVFLMFWAAGVKIQTISIFLQVFQKSWVTINLILVMKKLPKEDITGHEHVKLVDCPFNQHFSALSCRVKRTNLVFFCFSHQISPVSDSQWPPSKWTLVFFMCSVNAVRPKVEIKPGKFALNQTALTGFSHISPECFILHATQS